MDFAIFGGFKERREKMLKDCLEIFKEKLKKAAERTGDMDQLILDNYILEEGIYLIVNKDGSVQTPVEIKKDKKTKKLVNQPMNYEKICLYDYYSQLVSMDKPQDPKKVIHSNNYLSFWVKQESFQNGKMNLEAVDRYFDILANPRKKYTNKQDRKMYENIEKEIGEIDQEKLERNRKWIKENIFSLQKYEISLDKKKYLKIFFEEEDQIYIKEGKRYLFTKIFNKNKYNMEREDKIFGIPSNNMNLNEDKTYLEHKDRKLVVPYLISVEEAMIQKKFFDYLLNMAAIGKTNIFFNTESKEIIALERKEMIKQNFTGFFLQIQKGKEAIIQHQDVIVQYKFNLKKNFEYQNILLTPDENGIYKSYGDVEALQKLIDKTIFLNWLVYNYFTPEENIAVGEKLKEI